MVVGRMSAEGELSITEERISGSSSGTPVASGRAAVSATGSASGGSVAVGGAVGCGLSGVSSTTFFIRPASTRSRCSEAARS